MWKFSSCGDVTFQGSYFVTKAHVREMLQFVFVFLSVDVDLLAFFLVYFRWVINYSQPESYDFLNGSV